MDFFDASINRIAGWVVDALNTEKAIQMGLLRSAQLLREAEGAGDFGAVLVVFEDSRSLPWGAVWEEFCCRDNTPADGALFPMVKSCETRILAKRR